MYDWRKKLERKQQLGLSLKELAERTDLTSGFISQKSCSGA